MPYRRYPRRKVNRKKTAWYNKKYSTMQLAKKAWYATKYLKGLINSEKMYIDRAITLGATQSDIFSVNQIAVGDQTGQRTGNSILVRSLYLKGYLQINSAVLAVTRVSLCLVQDLQQISDTTPSITDIFTSISPEGIVKTGATTNTAGRFKILWRQNYSLVQGQTPNININKFWKLYSHVKFNGSAATDVQKNGYYLVMMTSEITNFPTISINARLGYYDN